MNSKLSRFTGLLCAAVLFAVAGLSASNAQPADIDDAQVEPQFVAGGHYTAEVDLQAGALTLLPIDAADTVVSFERCAAPSAEPPSGVYLVSLDVEGLRLNTTHPEGAKSISDEETHRLLPCTLAGSDANAMYLPSEVLAARDAKSVGAVYLKH